MFENKNNTCLFSIKYNLDYNVGVGEELGQKSFQFPQCKQFQRKTKNGTNVYYADIRINGKRVRKTLASNYKSAQFNLSKFAKIYVNS